MEESMSCYRVAVHYKDIANIPPITNKWFGVTVSKIHGKRNMYTDIQEYIQTHGSPGIIIPDARVITHDVAMQLAHFMIRTPSLGMVIQYDNPDNVPEILRYFVRLIRPPSSELAKTDDSNIRKIVRTLESTGFLDSNRARKYLKN